MLPRPLRWLARFDARDHLGDPAASIRANVDAYLATEGVDLEGGRVLMLATPRSFGYAFNPLTVFWCHDRTGALECVVAEVHNTYGERHCYLLRPDADGHAGADKALLRVAVLRRRRPLRHDLHRSDRHRRLGDDELRVGDHPHAGTSTSCSGPRSRAGPTLPRPSFLAGSLRHPAAGRRVWR